MAVRKAVRELVYERTPKNKGDRVMIPVNLYDNGLWDINGEVCEDDLDAGEALVAIAKDMSRRRVGRWKKVA